jgi:hypothetical protein
MSKILAFKKKYSSPEIETIEFLNEDIVTASSNIGASDGDGKSGDVDNWGWT